MKLVRYGAPGREKPGMIDAEGRIRDLSKIIPDLAGDALSPKSLGKLRKLKPEKLPLVRGKQRLGPCVGKVGNFIAIELAVSIRVREKRIGAEQVFLGIGQPITVEVAPHYGGASALRVKSCVARRDAPVCPRIITCARTHERHRDGSHDETALPTTSLH